MSQRTRTELRSVIRDDVPEISDLIVAYDPDTLERVPVRRDEVVARFEALGRSRAARIVARMPVNDGVLDADAVDGVLLRSHRELQRLSEEFQQGLRVRELLVPTIAMLRARGVAPIRIVDVGCGLGFLVRWLAAKGELGDDVELVGCDYNAALLGEAQRLAELEQLRCRFVVGNAFTLEQPGHIFTSTGVLHHFRDEGLVAFFREQARQALAFFHYGVYATTVLLAFVPYLFGHLEIRTLATVSVFGPLTLLRPAVIVAGALVGVWAAPELPVVVAAVAAAICSLIAEPLLERVYPLPRT